MSTMEPPLNGYSENLSHPHTLSLAATLNNNESPSPIKPSNIEEVMSTFVPEGEPMGRFPAIFDESVIGFAGDIRPARQGVKEMLEVVSILKDIHIPCCAIAEAALIYFGAARLMDVSTPYLRGKIEIWLTDDSFRSGTYVFQWICSS